MARSLSRDLVAHEQCQDAVALGRDDLLLREITAGPVLDIGGGTGWLASRLAANGLSVTTIDIDAESVRYARSKGRNAIHSDFLKFKPAGRKFRTLLMADVLEHIRDDGAALAKAASLLPTGGMLVISVPFSNLLWSKSDEERGHFRRYSREGLVRKLERHGFRARRVVFSNAIAIPVILASKLLGVRAPRERVAGTPLNRLVAFYLLKMENRLPLPFGSGIICVAEKVR